MLQAANCQYIRKILVRCNYNYTNLTCSVHHIAGREAPLGKSSHDSVARIYHIGEAANVDALSTAWNVYNTALSYAPPTIPLLRAIHSVCVKCGDLPRAISLWETNKALLVTNTKLLSELLNDCGTLHNADAIRVGQEIHSAINSSPLLKCNIFSLNCVAKMYLQWAKPEEVLRIWYSIEKLSITPDIVTRIYTLKACAIMANSEGLACGQQVHATIAASDIENNKALASALLNVYVKCNKPELALSTWNSYKQCIPKTTVVLTTVLKACAACRSSQALQVGESIHSFMDAGLDTDIYLENALLSMYIKCQAPHKALERVKLLSCKKGITPDYVTYISILTACAHVGPSALAQGKQAHKQLVQQRMPVGCSLSNALINMYAKCGEPTSAIKQWECANQRDTITCIVTLGACAELKVDGRSMVTKVCTYFKEKHLQANMDWYAALIATYTKCGNPGQCVEIWQEVQASGLSPSLSVVVNMLKACEQMDTKLGLQTGKAVHNVMTAKGLHELKSDTALLNMYGNCGAAGYALELWQDIRIHYKRVDTILAACVFNICAKVGSPEACELGTTFLKHLDRSVLQYDTILVNSILQMYLQCQQPAQAVVLWKRLKETGLPDCTTYVLLLTVCARVGVDALDTGESIVVSSSELQVSNTMLGNAAISMYTNCGQPSKALELWQKLCKQDFKPNNRTYVQLFSILANIGTEEALDMNVGLHSSLPRSALEDKSVVATLIKAYVTCGKAETGISVWNEARANNIEYDNILLGCVLLACAEVGESALQIGEQVCDLISDPTEVVIGTSLMNMYTKCGQPRQAIGLWEKMLEKRITPSTATYTCALQACTQIRTPAALQIGQAVHAAVQTCALDTTLENALVLMYAKCGAPEKALELWEQHKANGFIDSGLLVGALSACAQIAAYIPAVAELCEYCEQLVCNSTSADWVPVENSLLNLYGKCAQMELAKKLFNNIFQKRGVPDIFCWTILIKSCAVNRKGEDLVHYFEEMVAHHVSPNAITLTALLSGCSHLGLSHKAMEYLNTMKDRFNMTPTIEHYSCIVDALCRDGNLLNAEQIIIKEGHQSILLWMTLLGGCRTQVMLHGHGGNTLNIVTLAERAAATILSIDPSFPSVYVLLGNIYAAAGLVQKHADLRRKMNSRGVKKVPGKSWTYDAQGRCHVFYANDKTHPRTTEIYAKWNELSSIVKYEPDLRWVFHDESTRSKTTRLCAHSEKLALCFALLEFPSSTTLHILKNLRMCGDCHAATALISRVVDRSIVVRDAKTYHHFEDGKCSCGGHY